MGATHPKEGQDSEFLQVGRLGVKGWVREASDKLYKSRFFFMRLVSEKLSNFKGISAPRHATAVGGGKLDPIEYLNGVLRLKHLLEQHKFHY